MVCWDTPGLTWDSGLLWDQEESQPGRNRKMKVKLNLRALNPSELADTAENIHAGMVANVATFPNPNPTMPALNTLATTLRAKIAAHEAAKSALETALADRDAAVKAACDGLTLEAAYVDNVAAGDPVKIGLANMGVRATPTPVGPMPKVMDLKTTTSDYTGAADWMCKPVKGASAYIIQKCTADPGVEANWSYADTQTKSSGTVTGLAGGKVWLRVCARGAEANPGPWSDAAEEVVR